VNHNEPIAWAVLLADGDRIYDVYAIEEEAKAIDEVVTGNHGIIPLYRSPTLTDEEREAIRFALKSLDWPLDGPQLAVVARTVGASCEVPEHRMKATLRGLLERTNYPAKGDSSTGVR